MIIFHSFSFLGTEEFLPFFSLYEQSSLIYKNVYTPALIQQFSKNKIHIRNFLSALLIYQTPFIFNCYSLHNLLNLTLLTTLNLIFCVVLGISSIANPNLFPTHKNFTKFQLNFLFFQNKEK